jgi:Protein of unknown function (DUF3313)
MRLDKGRVLCRIDAAQLEASAFTSDKGKYMPCPHKRLLGLFITYLALTGCNTTHQVNKIEPSGFLGDDYSLMQAGGKDRVAMNYVKPGVNWSQYTKLCIKPFELWKSDDSDSKLGKLSEKDQQLLLDIAYKCVSDDLDTEFQIVDQPGPGVMVLRVAITDAKKSKPVLNLVSSIHPVGLAINYGKQIVNGKGIFVGEIAIEGDMRDGSTNELLAAFADRRAGTKAWQTKFNGSWGDVKLAFHWWTQRFAERLAEERAGITPAADD